MPNPQRENGHIDIANEIAEALAKTQLSGYESRVLWVLWRKTYGWHKKKDRISVSQFSQATGIPRRHIHKTLQRLVERNIVTKNGNSFITRWAFQKNYSKWKVVTKIGNKSKPLPISTATVTENGNKLVTENGAHKRKERKNTKERKIQAQASEVDNLIQIYKDTYPEHIEVYKIGGIIKMRSLITLAISEGMSVKAITKRIEEAETGTPWEIISNDWLNKHKKEKKSYDKLIKKYSND